MSFFVFSIYCYLQIDGFALNLLRYSFLTLKIRWKERQIGLGSP